MAGKTLPVVFRREFLGRLVWAMRHAGYFDDDVPLIEKLAAECGEAPVTVGRWFAMLTVPSYSSAVKLAGALGVSVGWLLFGEQATRPTIATVARKLLLVLALGAACLGLPSQVAGKISDMPLDAMPLIGSRRRKYAPA